MPGFWEHADLWMNQMVAGLVAGGLCGFLGIWVVLRRVVFVSAALGEVAGLGVVVAFFLLMKLESPVSPPCCHHDTPAAAVEAHGHPHGSPPGIDRPQAPPEPSPADLAAHLGEAPAESPPAAPGLVSDDDLAALLGQVGVDGADRAVGGVAPTGPAASAPAPSAVFDEAGAVRPYVPDAGARERDSAHEHEQAGIPWWLQPMVVALVFVLVAAVALSLAPRYRRVTQESVIGLAYLLAAGLVVLVGSRIPQGTHEIRHVLYGDSVSLDSAQLWGLLAAAGVVVVLQGLFFKEFLFVSFDPDTAQASGIPTRTMSVLILVSIGIVIAAASRAIGALPVFAFLVLPPLAALLAVSSLRAAFVLSTLLGALSAALGYYLAWVWSFPAGASRAVTAAVWVVPALAVRFLRRK